MIPSTPTKVPNKDSAAKTVNTEAKQKQDVDQNVRQTNPYKIPVIEGKPMATNTRPPLPSTPKTPDVPKDSQMFPPHSSPRFPAFSPPYPDMPMTPYSPLSPHLHVNPPCPPANHPILTLPRSQNPYFIYPNHVLPSPSNSTAGNTPHSPVVKQKLDFTCKTPQN